METADDRTPSKTILTARVIGGALLLMWAIELLDTFAFDDGLQRHGIEPRQIDGLEGVLFAPLLHAGWSHIISNSIPFVVLGGLVMLYGLRKWISVTAIVTIGAGLATWVLARSGNHIGASTLVFGYFGFLVGSGWFERSIKAIGIAAAVALIYGGLIFGVIPRGSGVSWEGHLFGVIAGVVAAAVLSDRRAARRAKSDEVS